jgi:glycosyltransferase involved in cell wall biosynthesis
VPQDEDKPRFSVIVPAYNEAEWLPECLSAVHEAMQAVAMAGEVVVVDNNSTDATADIAREGGARVVFEPVNQISRARNKGANAAAGDFLVFVDADTKLLPRVLFEALTNLESDDCCGGGATVQFDQPITGLARQLMRLWHWLARRYGLAAGCFVYCRRDAFDAIGGFSERVFASEEVWFSRRLVNWGKEHGKPFRLITSESVVTSSRKLDHPLSVYLTLLVTLLFPPAVYSRRLCTVWYKRRPRVRARSPGSGAGKGR